ncbi:MAG: discoidin domain-containing protein, partial [Chitinophagaceae bacterium]
VGNESGLAGKTNWNTITKDTLYAGKGGISSLLNTGSEDGKDWIPAETDVSIRPGWFYHAAEDSLVKSPARLFEIYLTSVGRGSTLLLNVPPDRRGLFHDNDLSSLKGFRAILDSVFKTDLARTAKANATIFRGKDPDYGAYAINDGKAETYWATDDGVLAGSTELTLDKPAKISYVQIQEYIKLGQRVKSFKIEARLAGKWKQIADGTTIGYKRILKIDPVVTDKVRITILDSKACPLISAVGLF